MFEDDDMGLYILDENKNPVKCNDMSVWGKWIKNPENKRVALTNISEDVYVSTVFLGIDHNFGRNDKPILFETMVFGGIYDGLEAMRYYTFEEALLGHDAMVGFVKE